MEDSNAAVLSPARTLTLSSLANIALTAFCSITPIFVLVLLFADTSHGSTAGIDFRQFYNAAEAILDGVSPYSRTVATTWTGPYPYPPLPALLAVPLTAVPVQVAALLAMVVLLLVALAVPYLLGVRDWRCYGVMLLWPPVFQAIQTGNVTLWFALALAIAWRIRDRVIPASAAIGLTLAVKFFLWPLVVWFAATRRYAAAMASLLVGASLVLLSWAVVGFAGFVDYPSVLRKLEEAVGADSYTTYVLGVELGLPSPVSRMLWLVLGLSLLAGTFVLGHRRDERRAFMLGIAASLALTPIVWMHYFALLLVVVSLARRRLALVWFLPLATVVTPGSGQHSVFQLSAALLTAAATIGLSLRQAETGDRGGARVTRPEGVPA